MEQTDNRTRVAFVKTGDRREGVRRSIALLAVNPVLNKSVLLKPNFNTADCCPGSTHPDTLRELIMHLKEMGAGKITIGERSGPVRTAEVIEKLGIYQMAEELDVELVNFDELPPEELVTVNPPGSHWANGFQVPKLLDQVDSIVCTPCLKTHQFGGTFTMTLKLAVGFVPKEGTTFMSELHSSADMQKMIAEINYAFNPDLIVLDGIEAFVEGGPGTGNRKKADLFIAGTDRIAIDAVGLAVLKELGSTPAVMNHPIFSQEQIKRAVELNLGIASPKEIELITDDPESAAYAEKIDSILNQG